MYEVRLIKGLSYSTILSDGKKIAVGRGKCIYVNKEEDFNFLINSGFFEKVSEIKVKEPKVNADENSEKVSEIKTTKKNNKSNEKGKKK